jgi:hypothetical protein
VLDLIRTALTTLVAELHSSMGAEDVLPTAAAADHAVNVVVTGKRANVQVINAQATGDGANATATVAAQPPPASEPGWWTTSRRVGAFIVGCAGVPVRCSVASSCSTNSLLPADSGITPEARSSRGGYRLSCRYLDPETSALATTGD